MSVIENIDVVMGARTEQLDAAITKELNNIENLKKSLNGMSAAGAAMSPVAAQIATAISAYSTSIPGMAAAASIFTASAAAVRASMAKKQDDTLKLANAMEKLRAKAKEAKEEVQAIPKAGILDPRGSNIAEAIRGGSGPSIDGMFAGKDSTAADDLAFAAMYGSKKDMQKAGLGVTNTRSLAEQKAFEAAIDQSLVKTATYRSSWVETGSTVTGATRLGMVGVAGLAAGVGVAVGGFMALSHAAGKVNEEMVAVDEASDIAKRLGMSFAELATVRDVADSAGGMDAASTDAAIQKMTMGLAQAAATGMGPVKNQLEMLGLDAGKLLQAGPVEALKQIAAATADLKNPTDQLMVAYDLFGKSGTAMVEALRQGPDAIDATEKKLGALGMLVTQQQTEQMGAANDAWGDLGKIATGFYRQIAAEVAPAMQMIYESVFDVGQGISGWTVYVAPAVDGAAYFAGSLVDAHEAATVIHTTLRNIATFNWTAVGEGITEAMTFDKGQANIDRLNEIRAAAAGAAMAPNHSQDSMIAQTEAARAASETAEMERKRIENEAQRIYDQNAKTYDAKTSGLKEEIALLREANALRAQGVAVNESDLRAIQEVNSITNGTGGTYLAQLQQEKKVQEQIKKDQEEASRIKRDSLSGDDKLLDRARELQRMKQAGMINDSQFNAQMQKAEKDTATASPEYRGAVSAQAGSVEAYKLLLERDKGAMNEAIKQTKASERVAEVIEQLRQDFKSSPTIRAAR